MPFATQGLMQCVNHCIVMKFGHPGAAWAHQEEAGMIVVRLIAGDELVGAAYLVRQPLLDQEVKGAIHRRWCGPGVPVLHLFEQFVRLHAPRLPVQQVQDVPADRREAGAVGLAVRGGLIEEQRFVSVVARGAG